MKDTNTKARAPQTPAPFGGTLKPKTNRKTASAQRLKKAAPVVQQAQTKVYTESVQDDVPDIEYMPPKPTGKILHNISTKDEQVCSQSTALPDLPDDVTYDTTFPQFQPRNRALGLESVYGKQEVGKDGLTKKQRKFQEDSLKADQLANETMMKQLESIGFNDPSEDEAAPAPKPQPRSLRSRTASTSTSSSTSSSTRPARNISTLRSREAAAALAAPRPSSASTRPAPVPKSRIASASSITMHKKIRVPSNPSSMRASAAAATSNTTMGYSKGRSVSSTLREKIAEQPSSISATLSPETYMQLYGPPPLESDMWSRCKAAGCFDTPGEDAVSQELEERLPTFEEDDEAESFQLTL